MRIATMLLGLASLTVFCPLPSTATGQESLIPSDATWRYHAEEAIPPSDWYQEHFDDRSWKSGKAGFGYGDRDDETVLHDMRGRYTSVFIRKRFEAKIQDDCALYLVVDYDDGLEAYLNGQPIARASLRFNASGEMAVEEHEAGSAHAFLVNKGLLRIGSNVLAIVGHNHHANSSDFSLAPQLVLKRPVDVYLEDINALQERLLDQSSYLYRKDVSWESAFKELRDRVRKDSTHWTFVREARKLVMQIGDCHADVSSNEPWFASQYLPVRLADTEHGLAGVMPNCDRPIDVECPYVSSIDGVEVDECLKAIAAYVPKGSPQLIRERSIRWLHAIDLLRTELTLPQHDSVVMGIRSADGSQEKTIRLALVQRRVFPARVKLAESRILNGNIGYLRIPSMNASLTDGLVEHIQEFRKTDGLIIDVRYNPGGQHNILRSLYGFFVPTDTQPYVTNIAAYRLSDNFANEHLGYRPTHRASWSGWSESERTSIRNAMIDFQPEWELPSGEFSEWHYMVLSRDRFGTNTAGLPEGFYYYDKPVVVLCNSTSFSAADNFLSAFAELPNVTLVGQPSGGGSGATQRFVLKNTRVRVAISSMASFRPNGKLHDGNGVEVDILVKPNLQDYLRADRDSVLECGVQLIRSKLRTVDKSL